VTRFPPFYGCNWSSVWQLSSKVRCLDVCYGVVCYLIHGGRWFAPLSLSRRHLGLIRFPPHRQTHYNLHAPRCLAIRLYLAGPSKQNKRRYGPDIDDAAELSGLGSAVGATSHLHFRNIGATSHLHFRNIGATFHPPFYQYRYNIPPSVLSISVQHPTLTLATSVQHPALIVAISVARRSSAHQGGLFDVLLATACV
jgi:hypothetical protein